MSHVVCAVLVLFTCFRVMAETTSPETPNPLRVVEDVPAQVGTPLKQNVVPPPPVPNFPSSLAQSSTVQPEELLAPKAQAQPSPTAAGILSDPSFEFSSTYLEMVDATDTHGDYLFATPMGHTVAAAIIATCLPTTPAKDRLALLIQMIKALNRTEAPVIFAMRREGGPAFSATLSQIAANLICKKFARTEPQTEEGMVAALFNAYEVARQEVSRQRPNVVLMDNLQNLLAASILLK